MQKALLLFAFITASLLVTAQTGSITGTITDAKTKEAIIGGSVLVQGTQLGASTNLEGKFNFSNLKTGTYALQITYIAYKTQIVDNVIVEAGKTMEVTINLEEDSQELEEVVITEARSRDTDMSVVRAIRESKLVVTGISAEQISKSQDRDAAQVVRRVPGVTLVDDRFVVVRGLSSRYSTVILNGVFAPSTESDSRAFSFDIIPSGLLDNMLVYKSGSADLPGEFAGSIIRVNTKSTLSENFTKFSLTGGYRANTTFHNFRTQQRSSTEFLTLDKGFRALPSGAPSDYGTLTTQQAANTTKEFNNNWGIENFTARPDLRFSFDFGRGFNMGDAKVRTINSISYSNTLAYNEIKRYRFSNYMNDVGTPYFEFTDDQYVNNVRIAALSNWSFQVTPKTKIEFRNLYTRIGTTQTVLRTGQDIDKGQDVENYSMRYSLRGIYSGQLEGKHTLQENKSSITWLAGLTTANRQDPDWKRASYRKNSGTEDPFQIFVPPASANPANAARFYQDVTEFNITNRLDFEYKFSSTNPKPVELKVGYWAEYKSRDFAARQIGYIQSGTVEQAVFTLPIDQVFSEPNLADAGNGYNGFIISENTKGFDSYKANNTLLAGYANFTVPVGNKFMIIPGVRVEYNRQQLDAKEDSKDVDNPVTSVLPFANMSYNLTESSLLRLAYSRTINRPEFRELAPFSFYDFDFQVDILGNENLQSASIDNVDLRFEYYPTPSEIISAGVFYKHFTNPIETEIRTGSNNPVLIYNNARAANNAGVEVEIRKSMAYNSPSVFLNNLSVVFNASYILSEIQLKDNVALTEAKERPMQGQSPYVINAGLFYQDEENGWQVNAQYNIFGKRIFSVGDPEFPTIWEMPRNIVDLTVSKRIKERIELKFGVSDLLNSKAVLKEDVNLNNKLNDEVDNVIFSTRYGQYFNIGVTYKF
jgi:TonB-dependent receptor